MPTDPTPPGRGAPAAPTPSGPTLDLDVIEAAASAADLACEFTGRAPWTARAADPRFPYLDQEIVGADGEVVARLLYGPELAAYIAAMSPDVALALCARVRALEAECARLRAYLGTAREYHAVMPEASATAFRQWIDAALATEAPDHA